MSLLSSLLQYRNTPLPDIALSPAQILLHRQLRDSIPAHPAHYKPHKEWVLTAEEREKTLSNRNHLIVKNQNAKARELTPLPLGANVVVQGDGKKWECMGNIVEVLPHRQYRIRMFHSGRVVLRNRRFLREYSTVTPPVIQPLPAIILRISQLTVKYRRLTSRLRWTQRDWPRTLQITTQHKK